MNVFERVLTKSIKEDNLLFPEGCICREV